MSNNNATQTVVAAIQAMMALDPAYWASTVTQRLAGGAGSRYNHVKTAAEMELVLVSATWEATTSDAVGSDCKVYRAEIAGVNGMVDLKELCDGHLIGDRGWNLNDIKLTKTVLRDRKGTGKVSAEIALNDLADDDFIVEKWTYLIVGTEDGKDVCFTFHPGLPLKPSEVDAEWIEGVTTTAIGALNLGLTHAKIVW